MKYRIIRVDIGSTDETEVLKYLEKSGKEFSVNNGVFETHYIRFKSNKKFIKRMRKDLNLVVDSVYYSFRELKS